MRVHFIAIGGAAMHNLALDLLASGWEVTGSDDEIYEPALSRLIDAGISPENFGWFEEKITTDIDVVILGMHAKKENPELAKALDLDLKVVSYPEFIVSQSINKQRIVIAGSHGKTTTTSIILHILKNAGLSFDYLVGSYIEGFDRMTQVSDAPIIVIEGDEYLSSPIDLVPKIHHYKPHISIITGISWDHINVFPTFEIYTEQFSKYISLHEQNATIFYDQEDEVLCRVVQQSERKDITFVPYAPMALNPQKQINFDGVLFDFPLIGHHNQKNASAAMLVCEKLGISQFDFFNDLQSFTGAKKRLQVLWNKPQTKGFLDFAHAPSKVKATVTSVKEWFNLPLIAFLELHTFSSLNETFLSEYKDSLNSADQSFVYIDGHTLQMKGKTAIENATIQAAFGDPAIQIITDKVTLHQIITDFNFSNGVFLFMSSGTFSQFDFKSFPEKNI
ncbi:MAG: peptidoglycan synthetase [Saprospiraceae bacterium]|nr:peptidoglycan synthetase [Saprospiraceae bacterium]